VGVVTNNMPDNVKAFCGLAADSRDVRAGFLFAALPGTKSNGSEFGTNGKSSVVEFVRQIWTHMCLCAASMGTVGIVAPSGRTMLAHTTPDPITLHRELARLHAEGVEHLALEASSHGLDQHRLDGVKIAAAAFTNITRDHLDYHPDFSHYLAAKMRLIDLVQRGGSVVVNVDAHCAGDFVAAAQGSRHRVVTVGKKGDDLRLLENVPQLRGQRLRIEHGGREYIVTLPLVGGFQASNALVAVGLCLALGHQVDAVFATLEALHGAPGRMELVAHAKNGAAIYVDYAHTPDAIEATLRALRPHVAGKIHIVFGCGGDRDRGKRPLMGEAAARNADHVIVTDDNPRSESADAIRREILCECHGAREIADRAEAIHTAIAALAEGDALIIAGKGHEEGQIVGTDVRPFSDRAVAVAAATSLGGGAA